MAEEAENTEDDIDAEAEGGEGEGEAKKKGGMKKLILFVGLPVVILLLGGVAGGLMFMGGGGEEELADAEAAQSEEAPSEAERALAYFEMEESAPLEITATFDAGGRSQGTLLINIVLVYADPEIGYMIEREDVQTHLTDTYMEFLRTLRAEDVNGSMGTFRLRAELLRRTNLVLAPAEVERVLLPQVLIQ